MKVHLKAKTVEIIEIVEECNSVVDVELSLTAIGVHLNSQTLSDANQAYLRTLYYLHKKPEPLQYPTGDDLE